MWIGLTVAGERGRFGLSLLNGLAVWQPNAQQLGGFLLKLHHLPHTPTRSSRNISTKYTTLTSDCSAVVHVWQRVGLPSPTLLSHLAWPGPTGWWGLLPLPQSRCSCCHLGSDQLCLLVNAVIAVIDSWILVELEEAGVWVASENCICNAVAYFLHTACYWGSFQ